MSFDSKEQSNYRSKPGSLYQFTLGPQNWFYASGEDNVEFGGNTYVAAPISDTGFKQSGDSAREDVTITLPLTAQIVLLFRGSPPSERVYVRIRRIEMDETDAPVAWIGTITSCAPNDSVSADVVCKMMISTFKRLGLRLSYGRGCPHALYDRGCRVEKANFEISGAITQVSGSSIKVSNISDKPQDYFRGGFISWVTTLGFTERRMISRSNGETLQIGGFLDGLSVGLVIKMYPGCNRTRTDCIGKFNNLDNYGGWPFIPGKSPFSGDPVY